MNGHYARLIFTLVILLSLSAVASLHAQDLDVHLTASSEVVGPNDRTTYTLTTTNTGPVDLTDVSVEVQLPDAISRISFPPPGFSCPSFCDANEVATWSVGTLAPGESRTVFYQTRIQSSASAGTITSTVTASATNAADAVASRDVEIDDSPLLRLSVAPESGPATAGEPFTYTLTFGNVGNKNPTGVVLTMDVPDGTSFVSATGGGMESGGTVTWNVGLLGVGACGQVALIVLPDASLNDGDVLEAEAEIDPNEATEPVARSSAQVPVRATVPLRLEYAVSQTAAGAGDPLTYTLTATNTGPVDLTDVSARLLFPGFISRLSFPPPGFSCSSFCDANEAATWTVGTLAPGESRTVFFRTTISGSAPQGELLRSVLTATSTNTTQVSAALDAQVDPSPLLRLNLMPDPGPAVAGNPFTYTLTFGNVGNKNPTGVVLTMDVPDGTSFVSATGGGMESGGTVTWNVGLLGVGNSKQVRLTVLVGAGLADGELISARPELDSGDAQEVVIHATAVTPVRSGVPLRIQYGVIQSASGNDDRVDITLMATNTGPVDLTDVSARLLFPGFISRLSFPPPGFSCSSFCDANEAATWTVGTLAPGESRTVFFRTAIRGSAPQGDVTHSLLTAEASGATQVSATLAMHIDPSPLLRLSLATDPGPAVAGNAFTYQLTIGNIGTKNPTGAQLRMPIPEGTTFVSASQGGTLQNGVVTWDLPILSNGSGGAVELTVTIDDDLPDGTQLHARAELDTNDTNEVIIRASATTPVRGNVPLEITYTSTLPVVEPGFQLEYTVTVTNTGPVDLTDVSARLLFPGFINRISPTPPGLSCSSFCDANEIATWTIGTLAPEASQSVTFEPTVSSSAQRGNVLRSLVLATATGSNEVFAHRDVFLGNATPLPVELTAFNAILDGDGVLLQWRTASETNNAGFEVQMRGNLDDDFAIQGFVEGQGTTGAPQQYRYRLAELTPGTYAFRLRQVDFDGGFEYSPEVEVTVDLTEPYVLSEAYPNPFQQAAELALTLREVQHVRAEMLDVLGRRVALLHDGPLEANRAHRLAIDGRDLASGLYLVRVVGERFAETRRVAVAR